MCRTANASPVSSQNIITTSPSPKLKCASELMLNATSAPKPSAIPQSPSLFGAQNLGQSPQLNGEDRHKRAIQNQRRNCHQV